MPARDLADGGEHGVEVDRLALRTAAGEHRPAGDDDGGEVEARGGHEHAGDDLVAVRDHAPSRRTRGRETAISTESAMTSRLASE